MLLCSPYKYFGPHMGLAFGKRELLEAWQPYKVRPATDDPVGRRFEHGTSQHELLAGFVAAVEYVESLGWDAIVGPRDDARRAVPRRGAGRRGAVRAADDGGTRADFAFNLPGRSSEEVATQLAAPIAVWHGDYYAIEIMKLLGLEGTGAVRAGFVHYNTPTKSTGC